MPVKRQSAYSRALAEAQALALHDHDESETAPPSDRHAGAPQDSATVTPSDTEHATSVPARTLILQDRATDAPADRDTVGPSAGPTVTREHRGTVSRSDRETLELWHGSTVGAFDRATVRHLQKTSFYLSPAHLEKLDDLAHAYKKRTGQRINRNDIIRHLVEQCALEQLHELEPAQ